jgi:YVTN family beta-propeller protein
MSGPAGRSPSIFVSYRTATGAFPAAVIYDSLRKSFGQRKIFRDVDSLQGGDRYNDEINNALQNCRVMIVVIDRDWVTFPNERGLRRLDEPQDWVRREIATALDRRISIVPLLVRDTPMPQPYELPAEISGLAYCTALHLRDRAEDRSRDLRDLIRRLRRLGVSPRRIKYLAPLAAAVVAAVVALVLVAPFGGKHSLIPPRPTPSATASVLGDDNVARATIIPTGAQPWSVALSSSAAWVVNNQGNTVTRISRKSLQVTNTIAVGTDPIGIAIDPTGAIWVSNNKSDTVTRINPVSLKPDLTLPTLASPSEMVSYAGDIWVTETNANMVAEINPVTRKIIAQITVGNNPATIAAGDGSLWIGDIGNKSVTQINPSTGTTVDTISIGQDIEGIAVSSAALWVVTPSSTGSSADTLTRIELTGSHKRSSLDTPALPTGAATDSSSVWVTCADAALLLRVGINSMQVSGQFPVGRTPTHVAVNGDQVWVTNLSDNTVTVMSVKQLNAINLNSGDAPEGSIDEIEVGNDPLGVDGGSDGVWITNANDGTATELDANSGRIKLTVRVGGRPRTVAYGDGYVWVAADTTDKLFKINPTTGKIVSDIPIPDYTEGMVVADNSIWVSGGAADVVTRISATTMKVLATVPVGHQPLRITAGFGAIWVGDVESGNVDRIDPSTNQVTNTIAVGPQAGSGMLAANGLIWVSDYGNGRVVAINPSTEKVDGTVSVGGQPMGIASENNQIWVVDSAGDKLIGIDPGSLRVTARMGLCKFPQTVSAYAGYLWATCTYAQSVDRATIFG